MLAKEPLRDRIGRALYEEPGHDRNWYSLSEERREPWRKDADRIIELLVHSGDLRPIARDDLAINT